MHQDRALPGSVVGCLRGRVARVYCVIYLHPGMQVMLVSRNLGGDGWYQYLMHIETCSCKRTIYNRRWGVAALIGSLLWPLLQPLRRLWHLMRWRPLLLLRRWLVLGQRGQAWISLARRIRHDATEEVTRTSANGRRSGPCYSAVRWETTDTNM